MHNTLYGKALQYAVLGYSVIPLKKDKRPFIAAWIDFQTTAATEEIIEGWFTKAPHANIGIVTGRISGITVIDIDTKGDTVVPLETFPPTFTVKTPSGGYHLYYQYDADIKQTANTYPQFPHLDIRNDGGYVVAVGSVTAYVDKAGLDAGGEYVVHNPMPPVVFPRDLFITAEPVKKVAKGLLAKITEIKDLKDGDGRNNKLCSLLGTMLRGQPKKNYPAIRDSFFVIAEAAAHPLHREELETIWNSIGGRAFDKAKTVDLLVNDRGLPYVNLENIKKIVTEDEDFKKRVVFDDFLQTYLYRAKGEVGAYRELHDSDEITITREISTHYPGFAMVNPAIVRAALLEQAREKRVDAARDYVTALSWDKTARLDMWLSKTYHVTENEYHKSVGSNWFKGMVKRVIEPGCKFDYVLVLEGRQGAKKSTSLGILGGAWHVETTASPDSKDFFMLLQGNLIVEFSEGETLSRGEIKQLKAVITTQYDKFRSPYERHVQTHPRRCVFAMTTNQTEYLKDETGNRRWLPVAVNGEADLEWLRTNRDQLFAEAYYRVEVLKETTYEFPAEVFEEQARRQVTDPNQDRIVDWFFSVLKDNHRADGITATMAFQGALGMLSSKFNKRDETEIVNVFKNVLKLESHRAMVGGVRLNRWFEAGVVKSEGSAVGKSERAMQDAW